MFFRNFLDMTTWDLIVDIVARIARIARVARVSGVARWDLIVDIVAHALVKCVDTNMRLTSHAT